MSKRIQMPASIYLMCALCQFYAKGCNTGTVLFHHHPLTYDPSEREDYYLNFIDEEIEAWKDQAISPMLHHKRKEDRTRV